MALEIVVTVLYCEVNENGYLIEMSFLDLTVP